MLKNRFNVDTCTKLNAVQASILIRDLQKQAGFTFAKKKKTPKPGIRRTGKNNVTGIVTRKQTYKINKLAELIDWRAENGLEAWIEKRFGYKGVKTDAQAWKVIEGLKQMIEFRMKKDYGPEWKNRSYENPAINDYIKYHGDAA